VLCRMLLPLLLSTGCLPSALSNAFCLVLAACVRFLSMALQDIFEQFHTVAEPSPSAAHAPCQ